MRNYGALLIALALSVPAAGAQALELRLGVKAVGTLSGMLGVEGSVDPLPEPFRAAVGAPPAWHGEKLGAGFGGGVYADLHFNRLLGLELDAFVEGNRLFFETTSDTDVLEQAVVYEQLRVPVMFKLIGHISENVEFTGALGPELLFGLGATPHTRIYPPRRLDILFGADEQFGLALSTSLGFGFTTKHLHIPLELRFGYNLFGAYSYRDRVVNFGEQIHVLQAIENYQFALTIGFGFRIPPYKPPKPKKPVVKPVEIDDPFYYPDNEDGTPRVVRPW